MDLGRDTVYQELLHVAGLTNWRTSPRGWKRLTGRKTYQRISALKSTVRGYIRSVAKFNGESHGGVTIGQSEVKSRELIVGVPTTSSREQMEALNGLSGYAAQRGVDLTVMQIR